MFTHTHLRYICISGCRNWLLNAADRASSSPSLSPTIQRPPQQATPRIASSHQILNQKLPPSPIYDILRLRERASVAHCEIKCHCAAVPQLLLLFLHSSLIGSTFGHNVLPRSEFPHICVSTIGHRRLHCESHAEILNKKTITGSAYRTREETPIHTYTYVCMQHVA